MSKINRAYPTEAAGSDHIHRWESSVGPRTVKKNCFNLRHTQDSEYCNTIDARGVSSPHIRQVCSTAGCPPVSLDSYAVSLEMASDPTG